MPAWTSRMAVAALAGIVSMAGAGTADAQEPSEFPSTQGGGWTFTPGVAASAVYDSNVALASKFPTRPDVQGDQMFLLTPSGQLEYHGPRTTFESGYRGNLRRYLDLEGLNGYDQRASASLRHRSTRRLTLFLRDSFQQAPTTDELDLNGVRFQRVGSHTNNLAAGFESRLTRTVDLNARYDLNWVGFDENGAQLRNGIANSVRTELARRLNERSSLGGEYAVRLADLNQGTHELTFQDVGITYKYDAGPHTRFDAAGGMSHLNDRTLHDTRIGPYFRAGLTHHMERATVGASYAREFLPTFGFGGSSRSESARGYVVMPLDRNRMYVQESVTWRRTNPLTEITLPLESLWLHSTVGYKVSRWLRTEGFYAYTRQDSRVPGGLINRHRIGGQLVISQPMRLR